MFLPRYHLFSMISMNYKNEFYDLNTQHFNSSYDNINRSSKELTDPLLDLPAI